MRPSSAGQAGVVCGRFPAADRSAANLQPFHVVPADNWDWVLPATDATWDAAYQDAADELDPLGQARILVIDDCMLYRDFLVAVIASHANVSPGVAWDGPSLRTAFDATQPRLILLNMATHDSTNLLEQAIALGPHVRVIVLGISECDEATIVACAEAGAAGYHLRSESLADLLVLMHKVSAGESHCSPKISAILLRRLSALAAQRPRDARGVILTAREIQILGMLELGHSNRDIADQLCIAVHTVKNHVHNLLTKLGVATRAQAAAVARTMQITVDAAGN